MSRADMVPSNWGLAPTFGEDLLYAGPIETPRVSKTQEARALGVPADMLSAHYPDSVVEDMTPGRWRLYRRVLRSRGQHSEVTRLSNLRSIAAEKAKCPGRWNPKTGCRKRKWYNEARDTAQDTLHDIASSPITQAAFTAASFTPLAPIAAPVGLGLQAADRLAQGKGLDTEGLSALAAQAIGVPPGAVPVATELGDMALSGKLDAEGLSSAAAQAIGVPPGAVEVGSAIARGDVEGLSEQAARAIGVPPGAVEIGSAVVKGDAKGLSAQAARAIGVPQGAVPVAQAAAKGDYGRAASRAAKAAAPKQLKAQAKRAAASAAAAKRAAKAARARARKLAKNPRGSILSAAGPVPSLPPALASAFRKKW